jgi:hypothetical protein
MKQGDLKINVSMKMQNEIYTIYLNGSRPLYPENIFEIESIQQLKEKVKFNSETQLFYRGVFNSKVLSVLGKYILQVIDNGSFASERLFKIFMELCQNISFYSAEKSKVERKEGIGIVYISYTNNQYHIHTGNIISNSDLDKISDKLKLIDSLDHQGLRELKRQMRHLARGEKGTANVGLIQVAITSEYPLMYNFNRVNDENSFYSITATINSIT